MKIISALFFGLLTFNCQAEQEEIEINLSNEDLAHIVAGAITLKT